MKSAFQYLIVILVFFSCKQNNKEATPTASNISTSDDTSKKEYPKELQKVFDAHGGIKKWDEMKVFKFEMPKPEMVEKYTVNLKNRKTRVESNKWKMGFNGERVWMEDPQSNYKGNPGFYYNLMFYFNAMPFVFGDPGISYATAPRIHINGNDYKGIEISYNNGVGNSSNDRYILYYNPETYKMEWLAYTATFGADEKSDSWGFINYGSWKDINGLLLPQKLTWYSVKDGKPVEVKNTVEFKNESLSKEAVNDSIFNKPAQAGYLDK